jgi:hypothetical protein
MSVKHDRISGSTRLGRRYFRLQESTLGLIDWSLNTWIPTHHAFIAGVGDEGDKRLVLMKTTKIALYAAVAANTSLPVLFFAPNARARANNTVATAVVPRRKFVLGCFAMIIVGSMSAIPPNNAIRRRDINASWSCTFLTLRRPWSLPKEITNGSWLLLAASWSCQSIRQNDERQVRHRMSYGLLSGVSVPPKGSHKGHKEWIWLSIWKVFCFCRLTRETKSSSFSASQQILTLSLRSRPQSRKHNRNNIISPSSGGLRLRSWTASSKGLSKLTSDIQHVISGEVAPHTILLQFLFYLPVKLQ